MKGVLFLRALDTIAEKFKLKDIYSNISHLQTNNTQLNINLLQCFKQNNTEIEDVTDDIIENALFEYVNHLNFLKELSILNKVVHRKVGYIYSALFVEKISKFIDDDQFKLFVKESFFYNILVYFLFYLNIENSHKIFETNIKLSIIMFTNYHQFFKLNKEKDNTSIKILVKLLIEAQILMTNWPELVSLLQLLLDDITKDHQNILKNYDFISLNQNIETEKNEMYQSLSKEVILSDVKSLHLCSSQNVIFSQQIIE